MLDIIFARSQCLGICLVIPCWCQAGARAVQYDKVGKMSAWSFLRVLQLKAFAPLVSLRFQLVALGAGRGEGHRVKRVCIWSWPCTTHALIFIAGCVSTSCLDGICASQAPVG